MGTALESSAAGGIEPTLKLNFYSHATLECRDIQKTRKFFQEFLGFETVQLADQSFWARLGGHQIIVVVQSPKPESMSFFNHNGLDVETETRVDETYAVVKRDAEKWGIKKVTRPVVQHGTYCFYFWDMDDNVWEILSNPQGGYSWGFERGDQEGKGLRNRDFQRPESTLDKKG